MQGSLDAPPIVIAADRKLAALLFLGALAAFAVTAWLSWQRYGFTFPPFDKSTAFYISLVISLLFGAVLVRASPLILSENGFNADGQVVPWNEFEEFSVGSFKGITVIEALYSVDHAGGEKGGYFGIWRISHEELANLLNAARERWALPVDAWAEYQKKLP